MCLLPQGGNIMYSGIYTQNMHANKASNEIQPCKKHVGVSTEQWEQQMTEFIQKSQLMGRIYYGYV